MKHLALPLACGQCSRVNRWRNATMGKVLANSIKRGKRTDRNDALAMPAWHALGKRLSHLRAIGAVTHCACAATQALKPCKVMLSHSYAASARRQMSSKQAVISCTTVALLE